MLIEIATQNTYDPAFLLYMIEVALGASEIKPPYLNQKTTSLHREVNFVLYPALLL